MGGSIGLSSSLGAGTTAYFTIPFHRPQYRNGCLTQLTDISCLPDRLQSDVSVSCRSSDCGISTPPESPVDLAVKQRTRSTSHSTNLLKRVAPIPAAALAAELERELEERKKTHVLVVEDSMQHLLSTRWGCY